MGRKQTSYIKSEEARDMHFLSLLLVFMNALAEHNPVSTKTCSAFHVTSPFYHMGRVLDKKIK